MNSLYQAVKGCTNCGVDDGHRSYDCITAMETCVRCRTKFQSLSDINFHLAKNCAIANARWKAVQEKRNNWTGSSKGGSSSNGGSVSSTGLKRLLSPGLTTAQPTSKTIKWTPQSGGMAVNQVTNCYEYIPPMEDLDMDDKKDVVRKPQL